MKEYIKKVMDEMDANPVEFTQEELKFVTQCYMRGFHPRRTANEILFQRQQDNSNLETEVARSDSNRH